MIRVVVVGAATLAGAVWIWSAPAGAPVTDVAVVRHQPAPVSILTTAVPSTPLPRSARHGLVDRLQQYPAVGLATAEQRGAARGLLERLRRAATPWASPTLAERVGFDVQRPRRDAGETRIMWFHSENRGWHADRHYLDPQRPDTLIFADVPHRPLILVGAMISMPRGLRGPTPGGPITRWHSHVVCVHGEKRGLAPLDDGSCPAGARLAEGSEMMHVWFTHDLRSAFAIHAPGPELCSEHVLPAAVCHDPAAIHFM